MRLFDKLNKFRCCNSDKNKLINKQIVKTVSFDKLLLYHVRSFTYRTALVRADEVLRVIVYRRGMNSSDSVVKRRITSDTGESPRRNHTTVRT
jgi:hypothetical protein